MDATTPIASVTNLKRLAVRVDLSEFDVARVKSGLKATVSVDALGGNPVEGFSLLFRSPYLLMIALFILLMQYRKERHSSARREMWKTLTGLLVH